jgi:hypothetical protein
MFSVPDPRLNGNGQPAPARLPPRPRPPIYRRKVQIIYEPSLAIDNRCCTMRIPVSLGETADVLIQRACTLFRQRYTDPLIRVISVVLHPAS